MNMELDNNTVTAIRIITRNLIRIQSRILKDYEKGSLTDSTTEDGRIFTAQDKEKAAKNLRAACIFLRRRAGLDEDTETTDFTKLI